MRLQSRYSFVTELRPDLVGIRTGNLLLFRVCQLACRPGLLMPFWVTMPALNAPFDLVRVFVSRPAIQFLMEKLFIDSETESVTTSPTAFLEGPGTKCQCTHCLPFPGYGA